MVSDLLLHDYLHYYKISSKGISVDEQLTNDEQFDLEDMPSPIKLKSFGDGTLSITDNHEKLEIVHYENFVGQCKRPASFLYGRKRCDYILCSTEIDGNDNSHIILAELTSTLGTIDNLQEPIKNHHGEILFEGGKYEKAQKQLACSLANLMDVPEIKKLFVCMKDKQCILAYKIIPYTDPVKRMQHPMQRYLSIESEETKENGAILADATINANGFTFRRLNHTASYKLG